VFPPDHTLGPRESRRNDLGSTRVDGVPLFFIFLFRLSMLRSQVWVEKVGVLVADPKKPGFCCVNGRASAPTLRMRGGSLRPKTPGSGQPVGD